MKNFFLKNPTRSLTGITLILAGFFVAMGAGAQPVAPAPESDINSVEGVFRLINTVFNILFWLLIVLAAIFIIMAAFSYLTAGGEPEKIQTANKKVIYAAVAVVVAVLAKTIPAVVCNFISQTGCNIDRTGVPRP